MSRPRDKWRRKEEFTRREGRGMHVGEPPVGQEGQDTSFEPREEVRGG